MTLENILVVSFVIVAIAFIAKKMTNKIGKKEESSPSSTEVQPESIKVNEPENIQAEMPIKPAPVNCKYATFRPAPEKFSYFDCCGKLNEGEGFSPWEKRSPVPVDINKPIEGMDITEDEAIVEC